ncbi:MAG: WW domain-containing protein [Proteobacteria bacterium]|nr:WW domain-containing protein [Pseudomonadota bacterium]
MHSGDKSPEVSEVAVDDDSAVAPVSSDSQPPVLTQPPPPLVFGHPGLMVHPPLLQSPIAYQPPMMQPMQAPSLPHVSEQTVKDEPKGPRPVKSIAIAGTPWSIVWSSDNRRFFFNATNRTSVWNIPEDLETNPFIHKILEEEAEGKSKITI